VTATSLRFADAESARFGLRVFRGETDAIDALALAEALRRDRIDVAILRVPARALASLQALREAGLAPIVADTIVRYAIDLPSASPLDDVRLIPASADDAARLESLTRETFAGYLTHYHANPRFPAAKILDGYAEWAASHVRDAATGSAAWLVEWRGEIAGFSCYRVADDGSLAIGVLNGVVPAFRGRGIYRGMLRRMLHELAGLGAKRFAIATQVQNVIVQRIWAAEGFRLERAQNTVHVNAPPAFAGPAGAPGIERAPDPV
jgi:GNAT superfamily N-acetyltransferase